MDNAGREGTNGKGLRQYALGDIATSAIGLASMAPAYSIAATLGFLVVAVGLQVPAVMITAFVPALLIAMAYRELNAESPDCGSEFVWVRRAMGPVAGWLTGWITIAADLIVTADLAQIASISLLRLVGLSSLAQSPWWTAIVALLWIGAMTLLSLRNVGFSGKVQVAVLGVEVAVLLLFAAFAVAHGVAGGHSGGYGSGRWFDPLRVSSAASWWKASLVAIFVFWGWDTAFNMSEETRDPRRTAGRASFVGLVVLLFVYVAVAVAALSAAGTAGLRDQSPALLPALGQLVAGRWLAQALLFVTVSSAAASIQTTILPGARTALSMAVHHALPADWAKVDRGRGVPYFTTIGVGLAGAGVYVLLALLGENLFQDTIASLGLMVAAYYAITGFSCAWQFARVTNVASRAGARRIVCPILGAAFFTVVLAATAWNSRTPSYGATSFGGVGGVLLIGASIVVMGGSFMIVLRTWSPSYFRDSQG